MTHVLREISAEGRPARYKGAPILVANGTFEAGRILGEFQQEAVSLPPEFVQFIQDKMSPLARQGDGVSQ